MNLNLIERIPAEPVVMLCLPDGDDDDAPGFAWRCTWQSVENNIVKEAGATYAFTRIALEKFVDSFKAVVDPDRPTLYHRPTDIKLVHVGNDLFNKLIFQTAGIVHHQNGFHPNDLESFQLETA